MWLGTLMHGFPQVWDWRLTTYNIQSTILTPVIRTSSVLQRYLRVPALND